MSDKELSRADWNKICIMSFQMCPAEQMDNKRISLSASIFIKRSKPNATSPCLVPPQALDFTTSTFFLILRLFYSVMHATGLVTLFLAFTSAVCAAPISKTDTHTGDVTFFNPGLGACGKTNSGNDLIVAVPSNIFSQL